MIKAEIGKFIEEIKQRKYQELGLDVEALEKTYQRFDKEQALFLANYCKPNKK